MATRNFDAPVLIAGGGLVGLSAAVFLAQHLIARLPSNGGATWCRCRAQLSFTCARSSCSAPAGSKRKSARNRKRSSRPKAPSAP